jgi:hypothetical protein
MEKFCIITTVGGRTKYVSCFEKTANEKLVATLSDKIGHAMPFKDRSTPQQKLTAVHNPHERIYVVRPLPKDWVQEPVEPNKVFFTKNIIE